MKLSAESAIKKLQLGINDTLFDGFFTASLILGCDALQRNIPKELNYSSHGYYIGQELLIDMAFCPTCDQIFKLEEELWESKFCPNCGQALNWEFVKDKEEEKNDNTDGDS